MKTNLNKNNTLTLHGLEGSNGNESYIYALLFYCSTLTVFVCATVGVLGFGEASRHGSPISVD